MQLTVTIWKKTISPWAYQQQQFAISRNWGVKKKIADIAAETRVQRPYG